MEDENQGLATVNRPNQQPRPSVRGMTRVGNDNGNPGRSTAVRRPLTMQHGIYRLRSRRG